jgi:hypothetical protein
MNNEIQKLITESKIKQLETSFSDSIKKYKSNDLLKLYREFESLKEDISSGDWARIGVMAGMLWYKLDMLLQHLSTMSNHLQNIERNTSRIKQ